MALGRRVLEVNGFFAYDERAFGRPEKGLSRIEISGTIVRRRAVKQDKRISTFAHCPNKARSEKMKRTFVSRSLALTASLATLIATCAGGMSTFASADEPTPEIAVDADASSPNDQNAADTKDEEETPTNVKNVKPDSAVIANRVVVKLRKPIPLTREPVDFENIFKEAAVPEAPAPQAGANANVAANMSKEFVGRELADNRLRSGAGKYMLEDELGEIRIFPQSNIASIEPAPDTTVGELRKRREERLLEEFGEGFKIKSTEHFIIASDASEGYVDWCGRLFERLEEGFRLYARKNNIELVDRGDPLIVVVFARQEDFIRYASVETAASDKLAAYYNMQTNRVALYDLSYTEGTSAADSRLRRRSKLAETRDILSRPNAAFNVATIVHEATHQIAFNRGVFLRTGPIALWCVEGLSLVFETPNGFATQGGWGFRGSFPKNERMINLFRQTVGGMNDPFRTVVAQEDFYKNLEGSYAASWALFYYLYKKKPNELAKYIKHVSAKQPCVVYPAEDRIADFEKFFGDDWEKTTNAVIRYVKRL